MRVAVRAYMLREAMLGAAYARCELLYAWLCVAMCVAVCIAVCVAVRVAVRAPMLQEAM